MFRIRWVRGLNLAIPMKTKSNFLLINKYKKKCIYWYAYLIILELIRSISKE